MSAYRTESKVRVSYELTLDDRVDVESPHQRRARRRTLGAYALVAGAITAYLAARGMLWAAVIFSAMAAYLGYLMGRRRSRRNSLEQQLGRTAEARRHARLEASDDGVVFADGVVRSELAWSQVKGWLELPDAFLVYTSPRYGTVVPKRAFDAEACATFRQLLEAHARPDAPETARALGGVDGAVLAYLFGLLVLIGAIAEAFSGVR